METEQWLSRDEVDWAETEKQLRPLLVVSLDSIRGCVRTSVRPLVRPSVRNLFFRRAEAKTANDLFIQKLDIYYRTILFAIFCAQKVLHTLYLKCILTITAVFGQLDQ